MSQEMRHDLHERLQHEPTAITSIGANTYSYATLPPEPIFTLSVPSNAHTNGIRINGIRYLQGLFFETEQADSCARWKDPDREEKSREGFWQAQCVFRGLDVQSSTAECQRLLRLYEREAVTRDISRLEKELQQKMLSRVSRLKEALWDDCNFDAERIQVDAVRLLKEKLEFDSSVGGGTFVDICTSRRQCFHREVDGHRLILPPDEPGQSYCFFVGDHLRHVTDAVDEFNLPYATASVPKFENGCLVGSDLHVIVSSCVHRATRKAREMNRERKSKWQQVLLEREATRQTLHAALIKSQVSSESSEWDITGRWIVTCPGISRRPHRPYVLSIYMAKSKRVTNTRKGPQIEEGNHLYARFNFGEFKGVWRFDNPNGLKQPVTGSSGVKRKREEIEGEEIPVKRHRELAELAELAATSVVPPVPASQADQLIEDKMDEQDTDGWEDETDGDDENSNDDEGEDSDDASDDESEMSASICSDGYCWEHGVDYVPDSDTEHDFDWEDSASEAEDYVQETLYRERVPKFLLDASERPSAALSRWAYRWRGLDDSGHKSNDSVDWQSSFITFGGPGGTQFSGRFEVDGMPFSTYKMHGVKISQGGEQDECGEPLDNIQTSWKSLADYDDTDESEMEPEEGEEDGEEDLSQDVLAEACESELRDQWARFRRLHTGLR